MSGRPITSISMEDLPATVKIEPPDTLKMPEMPVETGTKIETVTDTEIERETETVPVYPDVPEVPEPVPVYPDDPEVPEVFGLPEVSEEPGVAEENTEFPADTFAPEIPGDNNDPGDGIEPPPIEEQDGFRTKRLVASWL